MSDDRESPDGVQPFRLRGGSFALMVLHLIAPQDPRFFPLLRDKIGQSPNFFRHAPVVLDLDGLAEAPGFSFEEFLRRIRQHQLIPVGVQNGSESLHDAATRCGLGILPPRRSSELPGSAGEPAAAPEAEPAAPPRGSAEVITEPVRSGRQVYAAGGDMVVLASVSSGAELLAEGHIHVYGRLRGRALAGVTGDTAARIFCRNLDADLVSVAGRWLVREDFEDAVIGKPVQVFLDGRRLRIEPLA